MHAKHFFASIALIASTAITGFGQTDGFDQTHAAFTTVLAQHVKSERVNYTALKSSPDALGAYLATLASVKEGTFKSWSKHQRLAFLINLYNAATLKLVADHYPVKSIKDIGSFLKGPWDQPVVHLFGQTVTLNHIEHDLIRAEYDEPRAHFALVCASIGCPPLRAEAYQATQLSDQLDDQARHFFATASKNRVDAKRGVLHLSPILKWFSKDFSDKAGSVEKFIAPFFDAADQAAIRGGNLRIEYTEYDWSLNKQ